MPANRPVIGIAATDACRIAQSFASKMILFEQFQIGLPLDGNRIILMATVADPVDGSHDPKK